LAPVFCPQLNKIIKHIDCYETWQGIETNVLEELGYDYETAMKICDNCEVNREPIETHKEVRTTRFDPIICPELNREISHGDCYETRMGISNKLEEVGIEYYEAIEICKNCEAIKLKPTVI